jgi:hypothetical protein
MGTGKGKSKGRGGVRSNEGNDPWSAVRQPYVYLDIHSAGEQGHKAGVRGAARRPGERRGRSGVASRARARAAAAEAAGRGGGGGKGAADGAGETVRGGQRGMVGEVVARNEAE